jgi:hydroxymethylbilane synthase
MSASPSHKIVLGSRGSELARTQTALVESALRKAWPDLEIVTRIISTRGDVRSHEVIDPRAGRKGLFTGEIEHALARGEIDVAVHSAKDLPSAMTGALGIGAALPRAAVEDVLITKNAGHVAGAIATGSVRRQYQLRWKYGDVEVVDIRGNVPTRLRKFIESDWRGIVLARAGLERLGHHVEAGSFVFERTNLCAQSLSSDNFVSAGGQGIVALQIRSGDVVNGPLVEAVNDRDALLCLEAEREFLRLLDGDCGSPIGVLATVAGSTMTMRAQVFVPPRVEPRMARVDGEASSPAKLARQLWEALNG